MTPQLPLATAALLAAFSGFTALGLAMDRHWEDAFGRGRDAGSARTWLRAGGTLGLLLSLWASLALQRNAQGWVLWFGAMTAGALAVVLLMTYWPRRARAAGLAAAAGLALAGTISILLR
jgi:hypothetical protein